MKPLGAVLGATAALAILGASARPAHAQCADLNDNDRARLLHYIQKKYKTPTSASLTLAEASPIGDACFRKLVVQSDDAKVRLELYLSPDLRFLSRDLSDTTIDPLEEERRKQEALQAGLSGGSFPSRGPEDAAVTLTVFSSARTAPSCTTSLRTKSCRCKRKACVWSTAICRFRCTRGPDPRRKPQPALTTRATNTSGPCTISYSITTTNSRPPTSPISFRRKSVSCLASIRPVSKPARRSTAWPSTSSKTQPSRENTALTPRRRCSSTATALTERLPRSRF